MVPLALTGCRMQSTPSAERSAPLEDGDKPYPEEDKCMDTLHFTQLYNVDTNTATLSTNGFGRPHVYVCVHVFAFSEELQGDDLLWSRDEHWKHGQTKPVPNELTLLLSKHQFRLAVWDEPRGSPSPLHLQAACRQAAPPGSLLPPLLPLLTSWQRVLATRTRTLPFLACCLHWHLTAAADDQMGFWENMLQLFLLGKLSRDWERKNDLICVHHYSQWGRCTVCSVFWTD